MRSHERLFSRKMTLWPIDNGTMSTRRLHFYLESFQRRDYKLTSSRYNLSLYNNILLSSQQDAVYIPTRARDEIVLSLLTIILERKNQGVEYKLLKKKRVASVGCYADASFCASDGLSIHTRGPSVRLCCSTRTTPFFCCSTDSYALTRDQRVRG